MKRTKLSFFLTCTFFLAVALVMTSSAMSQTGEIGANDWPWWRGPNRNGIANSNANLPTRWSDSKNLSWKMKIPGRGHGSPIVYGKQVLITTANLENETQTVHSFDRDSGKLNWIAKVHEGGLKTKGNKKQNKKASLASTSVATDGERFYVNFLNHEAVWTSAISLDGKILWQKKISDYVVHQGYGSSPAIYEDLVIVSADNKGGGAIVCLKGESGDQVWRRERPAKPNYPSPAILKVAGRDQLLFTGCDLVTSLDPRTGKELWEIKGATTECVSTTVTDGKHIYTSGGYPKNHISAVAADGSGKVVWENKSRNYVPSMICHENHLYAVLDAGIAVCYDSQSGEEKWKARLGGNFSGSPIMANGMIFATNEAGATFVFKAQPTKFEQVAKNQLGESNFSSPAICGGKLFLRVAFDEGGKRQEYLCCVSK